jgi:hypothetical protein
MATAQSLGLDATLRKPVSAEVLRALVRDLGLSDGAPGPAGTRVHPPGG